MIAASFAQVLLFLSADNLPSSREFRLPRSLSEQESRPLTYYEPQDPPKDKGLALEEKPDETSFYPIPAITSAKNEGWSYGMLGTLLIPDKLGEINKVITVALQYRKYVELNGFADFRWSPGPDAVFEAYSYWAEKLENENQIYYDDRRFLGQYNARFEFDEKRVGTERFFGTGINTNRSAESAYASSSYLAQARFGPYVAEPLSIQGTFRVRTFRVGESLLPKVPGMRALFPNEYGIDGGQMFAEGIRIFYDTRNSLFTPTEGEIALIYFENAQYLHESVSHPFQVYGIEGEKLWPHGDDGQFVFVGHLRAQFVVGHAPFWELSTLGGGNSLRSYGPTRFTDNDVWVINFEERIRVFTLRLEGVTGEVQIAPFLDLGEVFSHTQDFARYDVDRRVHWSVGSGFRAVVRPYIVGRMDIGYGAEGIGITIGLDYPF